MNTKGSYHSAVFIDKNNYLGNLSQKPSTATIEILPG